MKELKSSNYLLKTDSKFLTQHIITKYINLGYNSLKTEELAFTLIIPSFSEEFYKRTGENWAEKYNVKTLKELENQNINLNFLNSNSFDTNMNEFLEACKRGDLEKLSIFYKKYSFSELLRIRDKSGKGPLHLAAKEGHLAVLEFLLENGHSLELRDRLFRTPLHIACLYGHAVFAEYIIRNNLDSLNCKDLRGRSAVHFASCSPTVDCLSIIGLYDKKSYLQKDYFLRSCLHYAVLNSSKEQIEFLRILLQGGVDINSVDEEGRTIAHYIASSGVIRPLPFLIEKQIDLGIKDKNGKTAIELAINNQTKESIIVLSTPKHNFSLEDKKILNKGLIGKKLNIDKENYDDNQKIAKAKNLINYEQNGVVPNFLQNSFYDMMKKLQKDGIENLQHLRKPYLFSGSWYEGVRSLEDLFEKLKGITAAESMIRTFNMVCPYEGELPNKNNEKFVADNFYGYCYNFDKFTKNDFKNCNCEDVKNGTEKIIFENMIKKRELEIINLKEEIAFLKEESESLKKNEFADKKTNLEKKEYEKQIKAKEEELFQTKKNLDIIKQTNFALKRNLEQSESDRISKSNKIKNLQKTVEVLNQTIEELNKDIEGYKNGEKIVKSQKAIIKLSKIEAKRNFNLKKIDFEQENAFYILIKKLKNENKILKNEIGKFDNDSDGVLTRFEFTNFLQNYLTTSRVYNLIDFFDLNKKYNDVIIEDILEVISKRNNEREKKEKELFLILLNGMKKLNLTVENFEKKFDFRNYDKNSSLDLCLEEFKGFLQDLKLVEKISDEDIRRLFNFIDDNDSGQISLEEFKTKLKTVEFLLDLQTGKIEEKLKKENNTIIETKKLQLKQDINNPNEVLNGELKIQCLNLNQNASSGAKLTALKIRLPGISKKWIRRAIEAENIEQFKFAFRLPFESIMICNVKEQIIFVLNFDNDSSAQLEVNWKKTLDFPDDWVINEEFFFDDGSSITLQIKFIPSAKNLKINQISKPDKKSFENQKKIDGFLNFEFIEVFDVEEKWANSKVYLQVFFFDNTKKKFTGVLQDGKFLINEEEKKKVFFKENSTVNFLLVKFYKLTGLINKDILIGETYIDFQEAINIPEEELNSIFYSLKNKEKTVAKLQLKTKFSFFKEDTLKDIKGKLKIKIHRARNLFSDQKSFFSKKTKTIDAYFRLSIELKKDNQLSYNTQVATDNLNPNFEEEHVFEIETPDTKDFHTKQQNLPKLKIELLDKNLISDDIIGECLIDWLDCFENSGEWKINSFFELKNKNGSICGEIYISLNFIPENFLDRNLDCIDIEPLSGKDLSLPKIKGKFFLRVLFLIDLKFIGDNQVLQKDLDLNPYLIIKMPNDNEITSEVVKKKADFVDNDVFTINKTFETLFDFENIKKVKNLEITVKNKTSIFSSDKIISSLNISIFECVNFPGDWIINGAFYLLQDPEVLRKIGIFDVGRIYLQARFVPNNMVSDSLLPQISPFFSNFIQEEKILTGKLCIFLVHCKDLPISDVISKSSDPFVNLTLVTKTKKIKKRSSKMDNNINPIFNELIEIPIEVNDKEIEESYLKIEVFDDDPLRNDLLGHLEINDLKQLLYNPNKWNINQIFNLNCVQKNENNLPPQIYIQANFLEENNLILGERPPLLEDLEKNLLRYKKEGKLIVNFKHCRGLPKIETNTNSVDPFVKLIFYFEKKEIEFETTIKKNIHFPLFDEKYQKEIKINDFRKCEKIKIEVWDSNSFLTKNELIGIKEISNFKESLFEEKIDHYAIDEIFELEKPPNFPRNLKSSNYGQIYLKIGFLDIKSEKSEIEEKVEKEKYADICNLSNIRGKLVIYLSHAKGLLGKDETGIFKKKNMDNKVSDPYVRIKMDHYKKLKSKTVKKTLNPIWSEQFIINDFILDKFNPGKILFEIFDKDNFLNLDDLLGFVEIDLIDVSRKTDDWEINKYFTINGKSSDLDKFKKFGEVYMQIGFFENEILEKPKILENLEQLEMSAHIKFSCKIKIDHIINIPMKNNEECKSIFYLNFIFPNKTNKKSKEQKNSYHPIYEELIQNKMSLNPNSSEPIKIELFEKNSFFKKDTLIGIAFVDSEELFNNINKWQRNGYINLEDQEGRKTDIQIYLKIGFFEEEENEIFEPMSENVKIDSLLIKGQLLVNILSLFDLDAKDGNSSDPFCEIIFGEEKIKTNPVKKCLNCEVNQKMLFDVKKDYLCLLPKLTINIWDHDVIKNDFIGKVELDILSLFQNKNKWVFNDLFELKNKDSVSGKILMQAKFLDEEKRVDKVEDIIDFPDNKNILESFMDLKKKGKIVIAVIHGKNLIPEDGKTCDPFVELKLNNITRKTNNIKKNVNPVFKEKLEFPIDLTNPEELGNLEINVFDYDLISNDLIGFKMVEIKNILLQKNEWAFNEVIQLEAPKNLVNKYNKFGSLYLQAKYIEMKNEKDNTANSELLQNEDFAPFIEKMEEVLSSEYFSGKLMINLIHCRNLLKADIQGKSDPYVLFEINQQKIKSKVVQNSLFPVFDQILTLDLNEFRIADSEFLSVTIFDEDVIKNEEIGKTKIDLKQLFEKKEEFFNKIYNLDFFNESWSKKYPFKKNAGVIYLQIKLLEKGEIDESENNLGKYFNYEKIDFIEKQFLTGKLKLELVNARGLLNRDGKNDLSDPYAIITIPNSKKKKFKTKVIKDNINPDFNETFEYEFNNEEIEKFEILNIELKDQDFAFDEQLGFINIYLEDVFQNKGNCVVDGDFQIQSDELKEKFKVRSLGTVNLKLTYLN